jgi:hypothetical protein
METEAPVNYNFLQRVANYGPVSALIHKMFEIYGSFKKNPTLKVVLKKAELSLEFLQPYLPDISKAIQQNRFLTTVDQFGCRQLDTIEYGIEKTKEMIHLDTNKDMVTNVKNLSSRLAENGKQLVQERVVKPVSGPVKEYIDNQIEMVSEKLKDPEVQEKIAPIQDFVVDKAQYVHEQIENNSQFESIKPHYERALAQVSHVVDTISNLSQAEEINSRDIQEEKVTETEEETQKNEEDEEIESTNFNYLRYNMTMLKHSL